MEAGGSVGPYVANVTLTAARHWFPVSNQTGLFMVGANVKTDVHHAPTLASAGAHQCQLPAGMHWQLRYWELGVVTTNRDVLAPTLKRTIAINCTCVRRRVTQAYGDAGCFICL